MKELKVYIREAEEDKEDKEKTTERGNIKYVIWLAPDKKVNWLKDNEQ